MTQFEIDAELAFARTAIEASTSALIVTNPRLADNPIVLVNDAFCALTGYAREEIIGRNCRFLQGPETHPGAIARLRDAIAARQPVQVGLLNYRKDGSSFLNLVQIQPILGNGGDVVFFVGTQLEAPRLESILPTAASWTFPGGDGGQ